MNPQQPTISRATAVAAAPSHPVEITAGFAQILFAHDIGMSIRLDEAERLMASPASRDQIKQKRRAPQSAGFGNPPLRITRDVQPIALGSWRTGPTVETVLYDFGAVSVAYTIPLRGSLQQLLELSDELYDNAALLADARSHVERLLVELAPAVTKPHIADAVEDYIIYVIEALSGGVSAAELVSRHAAPIAQVLRSERLSLSEAEVQDAFSCRLSYTPDDAAIVDWNAALLIERETEDMRRLLELANVELLETRFLDLKLDQALDEAYEVLSRRRWSRLPSLRSSAPDLHKIAGLQVDNAMLFEGINNAMKLLGDQYLARVYRLASQRFHLEEWDQTILRKLGTLESIYQKMADFQANRRMEILEWVIIILFIVSIVISLLPGLH